MERQVKKVMRSPMIKKRSKTVPLSERVTLERVLGVTVKDDSALACDPNTGLIAYPAGCVIVIFNPRNNKQTHIFNQSKKTITSLAFSGDGKNLVSGECGHNPAVRVWDVEDRSQVAELLGHKFGVACVAFSPNLRYVVSIGEQHDMAVNVWNWKEGSKVCSGKISNKVTGLCFSEDGGMFVTVGNRNVKFWYLSAKRKIRETIPLNGRSGILGEQRNNFFCSVACGKGANSSKTYCITKSGLLCEFNDSRLLDKWVELRTLSAYCLAASEDHLFVGCADGVLRVFDARTLHFVATFPKPHFLGVNVSDGIDPSHMVTHQDNAKYPDTIAMVLDDVNKKVTCIYNDHSIYVWDVHDVKKIGKHWSFLYHSSCIWGVEVYPVLDGHKEMLPPGSFITCSSDDTIRIWNTDPAMTSDVLKRNIYSKELLKMLYVDQKFENILDVDYNPAGTSDKTDPGEGKNGVRCLCVSPDGQYLASGDRSGNVRVHDLQFMDELYSIEAHDSEVLCLEFTKPETGFNLLASASRDRLIHVFNMDDECALLQTLDDHSSCITAVKFTFNNELQMISCGADKSLMFRTAVQNPDFQFIRNHHVVGKQTLYDLAIDPTKKFVATACQDRNLRIHNTATGKLKRIYKGSLSDDGTLIKVELDPSGMYVATSCSDKTLAIFDFYSGECVATMTGHSELVTGIKFSNDCKHLMSVSGDGCVFLWQLPWGLTHNMKERLAEMGQAKRRQEQQYNMLRRGTYVVPPEMPLRIRSQIQAGSHNTRNNNNNTEEQQEEMDEVDFASAKEQLQLHALESHSKRESVPEDYRFSMGQLPLWAKKQVSGENIPSPSTYSSPSQPKGRWAQRIDSKGIKVKSEWENTIEVRLEDCLDRRRYTVEPDALLDQVRILSHLPDFPVSEEEFHESVEAEFVSAEEKLKSFDRQLTEAEMERLAKSFVTSTRGSDPFLPPTPLSGSDILSPLAQDEGTSQDEEDTSAENSSVRDEEDAKEVVIIYPPSDESPSSPENFEITASTKSFEELARRKRSREESKETLAAEKKVEDSSKGKVQDSEVADPTSISTDDDDEEMEDDSLEEEEEEESSQSISESKGDASTAATTPDHDEELFLHTNFSFMEKEKFTKCLEQLQSGFSDEVATGRLSISSKFLSRSQLSQAKGPMVGIHGLAATSGGISAEQYLLRRKQEMAMAVDKTRRRLQMLGWKVSETGKQTSASGTDVLSRSKDSQKTSSGESKKSPPTQKAEATATVKATDTKESELDRADSLEDMLDPPSEQGSEKASVVSDATTPDTPSVESDFASTSPSRSSGERKPPVVPPKPRRRRRTSKGNEGTSSSSSEEFSRSESPGTPPAKELKEPPRKKELPRLPVSPTSVEVTSRIPVSPTSAEVTSRIPVSATSVEVTLVSVQNTKSEQEDSSADKENNIKNSPTEARRGSSAGSKARINKMKNKKERAVVMKRAASMSDIGAEVVPEDSSGSPSTHTMTLRNHPRSQSSERPAVVRSVPNSPAREKRRNRNDRIVPLLPNQQQKLKSYEIGTTSSRAKVNKVNPRVDTPPSSPHKLYKKKRSLLTELKENKKVEAPVVIKDADKSGKRSASVSPTEEVDHNGADKTVAVKADAHTVEIKSDSSSQASIDSLEAEAKEKPSEAKPQKSDATSKANNKQDVDRLAMPPPTSIRVSRSRTGRKSAEDSRVNEKRKEPEVKEKPSSGSAKIEEQPKETEANVCEMKPCEDANLRLSLDSDTSADTAAVNGHDVAMNVHETTMNGHDTTQNGHGHATVDGHERGNVTPVNGHDTDEDGVASAGSESMSSTCNSIPDDIFAESASECASESASVPSVTIGEDTRRSMSLDLSSAKEPEPSAEVVTPEELRAGVDSMKEAFESCISMFTKATSPDTPDIRKGHQMLDYLSSTLNSMQVSVARLQSQRRRFNSYASAESLSASTTSLPCLQDRSRATSVGFLPPMRSSSLTPSDVNNLKVSIAKTKTPGNGKSRDEETEAASALVLLDHYSEMLVSMVRDKIVEDINEGTLGATSSSNEPFSSDV